MQQTELLYLDNDKMHQLEAEAIVLGVEQREDDRIVVYLDQTILYPQGGGQPYDQGYIKSKGSEFRCDEVRFVDGIVHHIGHFEGAEFAQGDEVRVIVDGARRELNARLHSAGHLVDMAVSKLGLDWVPGKGYHFPDNPYVEYDVAFNPDEKDKLISTLQSSSDELIASDLPVTCRFVEHEELQRLCRFVPDNIPTNKPTRVVQFADFAVPCGGTHVKSLIDIKGMTITKLKKKEKNIRVGYDVPRQ